MRVILMLSAVLFAAMPCRAADRLPTVEELPPPIVLHAADNSFDEGNYPVSLILYDEYLASEPDSVHALVRSGLMLSWEGRHDEALQRYARALEIDPGNRVAARERAKVLSWSGQLDPSIAAWRDYLDDYPDDAEGRLALARALSWDRRFTDSRQQYQVLIDDDPANVPALVGLAQTHAWAGDLAEARDGYRRALEIDPDNRDARLGLAYLDLWSGDRRQALRSARELEQRYPGDEEVLEYTRRARRAGGPSAWAFLDGLSDTDENDLWLLRLGTSWGLPGGVGLTAGYDHYDMSNPDGDATIDTLYLSALYRFTRRQSIGARVGVDHATKTNDETYDTTIGGLGYTWGHDLPWTITAGANRDALRYSPTITDNEIVVTEYGARVEGNLKGPWRLFAGAGLGDFSDDNRRNRAWAGFAYRWNLSPLTLDTGYRFDWMNFGESPGNGYFSPQDFTSNLLQVRGNGTWGGRGGAYNFGVETGFQSFTNFGVATDNDLVIVLSGAVSHPLGRGFSLELFTLWGNYAAGSASGFESRQVGLRLRWNGGR